MKCSDAENARSTEEIKMNHYDSPIQLVCTPKKFDIVEVVKDHKDEYEKQVEKLVLETACSFGVDIDKEKLMQVINQDRIRYTRAYNKGWDDAMKYVKEHESGDLMEI